MTKQNTIAVVTSLVLLLITLAFARRLEDHQQVVELFAVVLTIIGSVYIGFALKDLDWKHQVTEISAAGIFILAAVFGLWWDPWLIAASLIIHGFWDLLHHRTQYTTDVPNGYIPFCAIYDWAAGGYFAIYLMTDSV